MNSSNRGFTLLELLVSLTIFSFITLSCYSCLAYLINANFDFFFMQDYNSFYQMRIILALAEDIDVWDDCIYYLYDDNEMCLKYEDNRIYITPGYNLLLYDVDYAYFDEDGYGIYLTYERDNHERTILIHK